MLTPKITATCRLTNKLLVWNGQILLQNEGLASNEWLSFVYKNIGMSYPKFFKMDRLSKAGILAAETLINKAGIPCDELKHDWAIACFNRSSSLDDDTAYQQTIAPDNFYPSPSVFVYTLANIVTGEMAIRYKILGETSFYITEKFSATHIVQAIEGIFRECPTIQYVMGGWVEYNARHCDILLTITERHAAGGELLNPENLINHYILWNN